MAEFRRSRTYFKNDSRLSNSIFQSTPACRSEIVKKISNSDKFDDVKTDQNSETTKSVDSIQSFTKFCVPDVFSAKIRYQQSPDIQFKKFKSLSRSIEVSANKYVPRTRFLTSKRLANKDRSLTGLFSSTGLDSSSTFPTSVVCNKRGHEPRTASDHMSAVRTVISTQGICDIDKLGCACITRQGHARHCVLRRLLDCTSTSSSPNGPSCGSCKSPNVSGVDNQSPKVYPDPDQSHRLPRYNLESQSEFQVFTSRQSLKNLHNDTLHSKGRSVESGRRSTLIGHAKLCSFRCAQRSASLPPITDSLQAASETPKLPKAPTRFRSVDSIAMVVANTSYKDSDSFGSCVPFCNNRCIGQRVGCHSGQHISERSMVIRAEEVAQQSEGNVGRHTSPIDSAAVVATLNSASAVGQPKRRELHSKRGGTPFEKSLPAIMHVVHNTRQQQDSLGSPIHSRSVKYRRRLSLEAQTTRGVDASGRSVSRGISKIRSARDRFIRLEERTRACAIRLSRLQRLERRVSRRLQQKMVVPSGVGIPPATPDPTSTFTSQHVQGPIHPSGATLVESVLAPGSEEESGECTFSHTQSTSAVTRHTNPSASESGGPDLPGSMASEGWCQKLIGWSQNEIDLLNNSWRSSTKKVYSGIWNKWLQWCNHNKFNHINPTGAQVAKYLAYLHLNVKLSYKTILVYKSTVATLACSNGQVISSDPIVQRMLKAISLANVDSRPKKSAIWDPRVVVEWLSSNQPSNINLFQVSRRTALILLLASSRRVHDLTLLQIDSAHFEKHSGHIVFHPAFGSKTDSYTHRQSSWKLNTHTNKSVCPVWWVCKLIEVSSSRRSNSGINNLFISTRSRVRPASRTMIGGWIKTILKEAGIEASPGSTRSASASLNWLESCNIDEIMAKGNWRVPNTFAQFYSAEINTQSHNNLSRSFEAV